MMVLAFLRMADLSSCSLTACAFLSQPGQCEPWVSEFVCPSCGKSLCESETCATPGIVGLKWVFSMMQGILVEDWEWVFFQDADNPCGRLTVRHVPLQVLWVSPFQEAENPCGRLRVSFFPRCRQSLWKTKRETCATPGTVSESVPRNRESLWKTESEVFFPQEAENPCGRLRVSLFPDAENPCGRLKVTQLCCPRHCKPWVFTISLPNHRRISTVHLHSTLMNGCNWGAKKSSLSITILARNLAQ